jgi:hypothetical protein
VLAEVRMARIVESIGRWRSAGAVPDAFLRLHRQALSRAAGGGARVRARLHLDQARAADRGPGTAGGVRLGLIGGSFEQYFAEANAQITLVVMVETEKAIANVRDVMAVPGVDVVLIGPGDLMIDVKARDHDEARHEHLALEVAAASQDTGVAAGHVGASAEIAECRPALGSILIGKAAPAACPSGRPAGRVTIRERRVADCRRPAAVGSRAWSARRS